MSQKKQIIMIIVCLVISCVAVFTRFIYLQMQEDLKGIYIEFIEVQESYEIGSDLEAISFIKKSKVYDIKYPEIDSSEVGVKHFFYIAIDEAGNEKEFVLTLNFVDPIFPIIELTQTAVEITEGDDVDLHTFVVKSYDPVDGTLPYIVKQPDNYLDIGTHDISYECKDKNGNTTTVILRLTVKEKPKEVDKPAIENKPSQNAPNSPVTNDPSPPKAQGYTKDFLFSDGYNMNTAPQSCDAELSKAGGSGRCSPLMDSEGLYYGVRLQVY